MVSQQKCAQFLQQNPEIYSPFCVQAKVIKLVGLKRPPFLSPTNLITFTCTQNGEYKKFPIV
jgi:hypothetical protein